MKRLLILLVSGMLSVAMIACNGVTSSTNETSTEESSSVAESVDASMNEGTSSGEVESSVTESTEESTQESTEETEPEEGSYLEDLYEFKVNIGKIAYRLPITYSSMTSRGWIYEGNETITLKPSQYTSQELMDRDDVILLVSFLNVGIHTQEIKDSLIGQITFDKLNLIGCETEIQFPGNIVYGTSTKEDVLFAYGEPTDLVEVEGKEQEQLVYEQGEFQHVIFTIDKTTNVISSVDMCNFTEPENFENAEISEDTPQEVLDYEAPEKLGTDLNNPYVEIGENIYKLPAPVSAFLENDWSIVEADSHEAVVAKGVGNITLEKDGLYITTDVINYADTALYVENCFVVTVYADLEENAKATMEIPNEICLNMPLTALEEVLEGVDYTTSKDKKYTYYTISHSGGEENGFIIRVNKTKKIVDSISCKEIPDRY